MRITGLVFAMVVLGASPVLAADEDPGQVSVIAGDFGGGAQSCGLETQTYSSRVEKLLKHMAGTDAEAEQLIGTFNDRMKATVSREETERTIDCMDLKRRFEDLPINQPTWTVDTGWASEML
jgi:Fe-S cluster biogenesis protein NfuA